MGAHEFLTWLAYFNERELEKKPEHYFQANVAYQIYLLRHAVQHMFDQTRPPPEWEFDDFMFEFTIEGAERKKLKKAKEVTQESPEEKQARLKHNSRGSAWWGAGGKAKEGEKKKRHKAPPPLPPEVVKKTRENLEKRRGNQNPDKPARGG